MNEAHETPTSPDSDYSDLNGKTARILLKFGLDNLSPAERLVMHLEMEGPDWAEEVIQRDFGIDIVGAAGDLLGGSTSIGRLTEIKEKSKAAALEMGDDAGSLAFTFAYFLSIASALAVHRELITKVTPEELCPVLKGLSDAAPPPSSEIFAKAVEVLAQLRK